MAETGEKDDGAITRLQSTADRLDELEAATRRRVLSIHSTATDSTLSTSYVDLGPSLAKIRPGASGRLLMNVSAGIQNVGQGQACFVSYRLQGPTPVASDDGNALFLLNNTGAGTIYMHASYESLLTGLKDGIYTATLTIRSYNGALMEVSGRGITATPV